MDENEKWLWENDFAKAMVDRGLQQAANGELGTGPPLPGERLASDAQYMDPQSAERARALVDAWRTMAPGEFEESASRL